MKKIAGILLLAALLLCGKPVWASEEIDAELQRAAAEQAEALGTEELTDSLPGETRDMLEDLDLTSWEPQALLRLSPGDFVRVIWQHLRETVRQPFVTMCAVAGILVLCALMDAFKSGLPKSALSPVFSTVAALCVMTSVAKPLTDCILNTANTLHDCGTFMLGFIPAFTSIITVGGAPITATTYNMLLFTVCQLISGFASSVLIPFMGIYMGLCIAGSVGEDIGVLPLAKGIRTFVTWCLTLAMTSYVGLLSMQTLVSTGADSAMMKTGKFLVGSFVPIVGGAISDALSAARGAVHLLKTTVGAFGIIAGALMFLPVLAQVGMWCLALKGSAFFAQVLNMKKLGGLLDACSSCLSTMLAMLFSFMLLIIISIVLLLSFSSSV